MLTTCLALGLSKYCSSPVIWVGEWGWVIRLLGFQAKFHPYEFELMLFGLA